MLRLPLVLICILSYLSATAQNPVDKIRKEFLKTSSGHIMVASHRAVHHHYPENSIPAIREAIRLGIDIVEIDVKVSKDGVPMLMHDGKIDRTTNGKGDLETQNYEDLRKLRLVSNGRLTDEKIPTLEEVLLVAKGNILVDLDLKTSRIDKVVEVVRKTKTNDIVFYFDSDYAILSKVDSMESNSMLMPRAYNLAMADSALKLYSPQVVHIDSEFYTTQLTSMIKKGRARIWINALGKPDQEIKQGNEKQAVTELIQNGANIIQTDEPEKLLKYLRSVHLHP